MNKVDLLREEQVVLRALELTMHTRNRLIAAAYAASPAQLEQAAVAVKAALRGASPPARPRRYQSLEDELGR